MKSNKIEIIIQSPVSEVFEYTVNPENTPLWIEEVSRETINTNILKIGTIYSNEYGEMEVTQLENNKNL